MPFKRDSLATVLDRVYENYMSRYKPLDKTPRHNLLKIFAAVDAGIYHELLGDLDFLSRQLFPDTASGAYLREHWSSRTPPLYAAAAEGEVSISGLPGRPVPAGLVFKSASGGTYYSESAGRLDAEGKATVRVKAQDTGITTNLEAAAELSLISAIPAGVNSKAVVSEGGVTGGADAESDEEYLVRVLTQLRNPARYGKEGDFAAWALDSSPEVSSAWEYKNFGVFGAVLIQVINGSQTAGVSPVANLDAVRSYLNENAPPVLFEVRTPEIVSLNPAVTLPLLEDTQHNRELAEQRINAYMQLIARPGERVTAGVLRSAVIDGVDITDALVRLNGDVAGIVQTTILQYPYAGEVQWA
ncbi:MAG: baseplate J/gp47 family protein [Treponema sp.]|jgi:uncharacterized phage protein gp47/JayE|nr:baseplate J/gp47 family protein [Treponema sp.]